MKKYQAIILVHGCFWHRHECSLFKWPKTRSEFWREQLNRNHENDLKVVEKLRSLGWRVCVVWECSMKGAKKDVFSVATSISDWLQSQDQFLEISA